jgi:hypothetical protein
MSHVQVIFANGQPSIARIFLSWTNICERFLEKFDEQFHGKRKAHFDTLPSAMRTVDGARGKWSLLILLDAIVYLLNASNPTTTIRRYFNQHRVLCDSILAELHAARTSHHNMSELDFDNLCGNISVVCLPLRWMSLASFEEYHVNNAPTKARAKFLSVLNTLTTHACIRECSGDLLYVLKKVVLKVISDHGMADASSYVVPKPAQSILHCPSPRSPRSPSRRSMSIDSGIEANMFLNTRNSSFSIPPPLPATSGISFPGAPFMSNQLPPTTPSQRAPGGTVLNDTGEISFMGRFADLPAQLTSGDISACSFPLSRLPVFSTSLHGKEVKSSPHMCLMSESNISMETVCQESDSFTLRPSCSTIDDNDTGRSALQLHSQMPLQQLPLLDVSTIMDSEDIGTPKDTYDWADFVQDFSRDGDPDDAGYFGGQDIQSDPSVSPNASSTGYFSSGTSLAPFFTSRFSSNSIGTTVIS